MSTIQSKINNASIYQNAVYAWWSSSLRDWYVPPDKEIDINIYVYSDKVEKYNLTEFKTYLKENNQPIVITGLSVLLATIIWTNHPSKHLFSELLSSSHILPLEKLEDIISTNFKALWPTPQAPALIIEPDIAVTEKLKRTKTLFTNMMRSDEIKKTVSSEGIYLFGLYYDIVRDIAALLCGWQGVKIDTENLEKWIAEYQEEVKKNPDYLEENKVVGRHRSALDIYDSVFTDSFIHPAYISDPFGRTYTFSPNIQVFEYGPPKSPRSLIITDKQNKFYYSDASTANLHPLAEIWRTDYANDPRNENLARDIEDPFDIHFRTGLFIKHPELFTRVKELIAEGNTWQEAAKTVGIKNAKIIRSIGKDINFAIPNGVSFTTMQANARNHGFELTNEIYTRFRRAYDKRYPIDKWLAGGHGEAIARTLTGRTHITNRQPQWSSFRIQATIADLFSLGIYLAAINENIFPSMWIHDSVIYESSSREKVKKAILHFEEIAEEWFPLTTMRFSIENIGKRLEPLS